ncbi:hypothetical protein QE357_005085 [Siphonobacter sp. BAB-5404]|nr:hypothetical protein [Siphonobacter sp. SORGH_AS_0500]
MCLFYCLISPVVPSYAITLSFFSVIQSVAKNLIPFGEVLGLKESLLTFTQSLGSSRVATELLAGKMRTSSG